MRRAISLVLVITLAISNCLVAVAQERSPSTSIVNIGGESFYIHTVKKGETLYSIAKLYNTTEREVIDFNPSSAGILSLDMTIKIPYKAPEYTRRERKKRNKQFIKHTIVKGETAYSIAKQYEIPVTTLIEDNPTIEIVALPLDMELNIRKNQIGDSDPREIKEDLVEYAENLNSVSDEHLYHVVVMDDTFYKLSKRYAISIDEIKRLNDIHDSNLRLGTIIKVGRVKAIVVESKQPTIDTINLSALYPDTPYSGGDIVRKMSSHDNINIALFIPIQQNRHSANSNFLEFYQGSLLAIKSLKDHGINVNLDIFNSERSPAKVAEIIRSGELDNVDLIIGPIYEECADPIVKFAEQKRVPVVSPLATFNSISSPVLFQLSPTYSSKYNKLSTALLGEKNVIIIKAERNDSEFEKEIQSILPQQVHTLTYNKLTLTANIDEILSAEKDNIFIILASNPYRIDEILARISSMQNNILARSLNLGDISVIGTSKWTKHNNIDKTLFFKLKLRFVTLYHADKSNERISSFDSNYIKAFRSLPSQYAYRAYDAVKLFGYAVTNGGDDELIIDAANSSQLELLQMSYMFQKLNNSESISNINWGVVKYNKNYTIDIE